MIGLSQGSIRQSYIRAGYFMKKISKILITISLTFLAHSIYGQNGTTPGIFKSGTNPYGLEIDYTPAYDTKAGEFGVIIAVLSNNSTIKYPWIIQIPYPRGVNITSSGNALLATSYTDVDSSVWITLAAKDESSGTITPGGNAIVFNFKGTYPNSIALIHPSSALISILEGVSRVQDAKDSTVATRLWFSVNNLGNGQVPISPPSGFLSAGGGGNNEGLIIGLSVGGVILFLTLFVWFGVLKRKKSSRAAKEVDTLSFGNYSQYL